MKIGSWVRVISSLLMAMGASALWGATTSPDTATIDKGSLAPAWELKDVNNKTVRSADFKGKVVVLDFWATWCPPCRAELPGLIDLQKAYAKEGFTVVGVSVDDAGAKVVADFMQKSGINYPVVMADGKVVSTFGVTEGIPTTFIIDREGKVASRHLGYLGKEDFEKEIKPLLKAPGAPGAASASR